MDFEFTIIGPGYGESIVLHVGNGMWIVVDSCLDPDKKPSALSYLENIGVDPARDVALIVATHWHDDHVRGLARLVETCSNAHFCCAGAFCKEEFTALVGALEGRHFSARGFGVRELHRVFSRLRDSGKNPIHALANRVVFRKGECTISSLSPRDGIFQRFIKSVEQLIPDQGENKIRIPSLSPNDVSVTLWVECGKCLVLLGADLERRGWMAILADEARPVGAASVFKIPHHGSEGADEPAVWDRLLEDEPFAALAPWRLGGKPLPTMCDVERILSATPNVWITSKCSSNRNSKHENREVARTLREMGVRLRRLTGDPGMIRLRRPIDSDDPWAVQMFGAACRLADYTV